MKEQSRASSGHTTTSEHCESVPSNSENCDKPEDIAHLYEVVPEQGTERILLHVYDGSDGERMFIYTQDGQVDAYYGTTNPASGHGLFRLREQWEPCEVVIRSDSGFVKHVGIYEHNTATGEVRQIKGDKHDN